MQSFFRCRGQGDPGAYEKIGITPVAATEEEFVIGKANYAEGIRANQMTRAPLYGA
jgi:hypothetical protein